MSHILPESSIPKILHGNQSVQIDEAPSGLRKAMQRRLASLGIDTWDGWIMIREFLPPNVRGQP